MAKYIDAEPLYNQIVEKEELARQRVVDTPSRLPNGDVNPYAIRYAAQLDERTTFKFMLADAPAADVVEVVRCKDCKHRPIATMADEGILWGFSVEFPDERCPLQCEDGWYNYYPKDDFYCANAERRTDE